MKGLKIPSVKLPKIPDMKFPKNSVELCKIGIFLVVIFSGLSLFTEFNGGIIEPMAHGKKKKAKEEEMVGPKKKEPVKK